VLGSVSGGCNSEAELSEEMVKGPHLKNKKAHEKEMPHDHRLKLKWRFSVN